MVVRTPLVSIVTPSYNQAAFLEHTIASVLKQDYPAIEYLVVDGGSTDGSVEIIQRNADRLDWWISEPDKGQAEAINKGLQRARGEIVAWLNSDDLYVPGAVSQAVAAMQADPQKVLIYGNAVTINAQGIPLNALEFPDWGLDDLLGFRIICQPAVFMRRQVLERVGYLDLSYHFMLDHHLWLRIANQGPIGHVPHVWAAARHHPGAKNIAQPVGFSQETRRLLDWLQSQPEYKPRIRRKWRQVMAGANRLNARYLLDGGFPREALKAYLAAFRHQPGYALQHWKRMLYAVYCLVSGDHQSPASIHIADADGKESRKTHLTGRSEGELAPRPARLKSWLLFGWYSAQEDRRARAARQLTSIPGIDGWPGLSLSSKG